MGDIPETTRSFRILTVVILVILSIQAWFGDFVNIFVSPPYGVNPPPFSIAGFITEVDSLGLGMVYHASEGFFLLVFSALIFALSFRLSKSRAVRITAGLGFLSILSAAIGGFEFVMSGFSNGGNSAQMGGSFISAYAMFFISLYYSKN